MLQKYRNEWGTLLTLSSGGSSNVPAWMEYAMKQSTAPIHSSKENPPNKFLQNFTHSGVFFGGVKELGPSLSKISLACCDVRPCKRGVPRGHKQMPNQASQVAVSHRTQFMIFKEAFDFIILLLYLITNNPQIICTYAPFLFKIYNLHNIFIEHPKNKGHLSIDATIWVVHGQEIIPLSLVSFRGLCKRH